MLVAYLDDQETSTTADAAISNNIMRFHWYWPFARGEELEWARATARVGERIVVQVLDREQAPEAGDSGEVSVIRDLPDVDRSVNRIAWPVSRMATYRSRSTARRRLWRADQFDLVHLHYVNRFTDAFTDMPHPLVMSVHDVTPHIQRLGTRVEHQLLARLYHRPDALVVHHARLLERLREDFDVPGSKISVVPHQVFPVGEPPTPRPDSPPRLLFFGTLRPNKGLEVLDEAMKLLSDSDLQLTIAGRGDERLERLAIEMASRDPRITAEIGFATLNRKRELFRAAHVVVLPYTSFASQSGVLHDAYGHGRPVVVSEVGALGATVTEEGTGVVVDPGNPVALANAIIMALETDVWESTAAACRRVAIERSPQKVGRLLREVYDEVLYS